MKALIKYRQDLEESGFYLILDAYFDEKRVFSKKAIYDEIVEIEK